VELNRSLNWNQVPMFEAPLVGCLGYVAVENCIRTWYSYHRNAPMPPTYTRTHARTHAGTTWKTFLCSLC
jgi:hypothetical protein